MRKYKYGDCIPESEKIYKKLKWQGKAVVMVEGYVEVNDEYADLLPDMDFLGLFYPKIFKDYNNRNFYNDYPKSSKHTWVECNGQIIDKTKNQFDKYGGVKQYYISEKYHL